MQRYRINHHFLIYFSVGSIVIAALAYFAHGWHLQVMQSALVSESFQAWKFGPVLPSIFYEFAIHGNRAIPRRNKHKNPVPLSKEVKSLLNDVWNIYGKHSGTALCNHTHEPSSPWSMTEQLNKSECGLIIEDNLIQVYFMNLAESFDESYSAA